MLAILEKHRVTTFCAPPTIYRFMLLEDVSQYDLSALKHCSIAGEPLSPELYNKWKEQTGHELYEIYGQTELCVTIGTFPWMKICPGSMGKPSPLFDVDLIDDDGNTCPPGVVGEIVVRVRKNPPPGMFMGYYRDPERTKSVWSDGIYHTLDLAWRDEWGYFWYVGRADDVIKSSGYRIGRSKWKRAAGASCRDGNGHHRRARPGARPGREGDHRAQRGLRAQRRVEKGIAGSREAHDRAL